ncbi:MAG: PKD domain-containing protein [Euryarchaeota archaeon]|nr:PKD domain-containing protein [Euryarchaeota archaeon]
MGQVQANNLASSNGYNYQQILRYFYGSDIKGLGGTGTTYNPQAAVNYADTWCHVYNSNNPYVCDPYQDYSSRGGDCANFVSQCLIAGGLDLSAGTVDSCGCIISCTKLNVYLVNSLCVQQYETWSRSRVMGPEREPIWFVPGDPAIFGKNDAHPTTHAVIAVSGDASHYATCDSHTPDVDDKSIRWFFTNYPDLDRVTFYHIPVSQQDYPIPTISASEYETGINVGDTDWVKFTVTNDGTEYTEEWRIQVRVGDGLELVEHPSYPWDQGNMCNGEAAEWYKFTRLDPGESDYIRVGIRGTSAGSSEVKYTAWMHDPDGQPKPIQYAHPYYGSACNREYAEYGVEVTQPDITPPPPPVISSSTHPNENNWYDNNDPSFTWTTPSDTSGIAGYSYTIDHSSSTTPDTSVDTTGNSKSYSNKADGTWYFHVRAKDGAGNWGNADHYRVKIDTTKPSSQVNALSPTQTTTSFTVSWTGSDTGGSDLKWYDVQYKDGSGGTWTSWKTQTISTSDTFGPNDPITVQSGHTYYFQSRAQDNAGNWETYPGGDGDTHTTISVSDTTPPTWDITVGIQSATDTGNGGEVTVTYGTATDADTPPVKYNVYYSTSSPATGGTKLSDVGSSPYIVTGLTNGLLYYFSVRAEDSVTSPNEDTNSVERTATPTAPDTTPPASITNLMNVTGETWINWTWINPTDADFNYTMVYLNGTWQINTSDSFYNVTELNPDTYYEIGTHAVDKVGNVNITWVNQTAKTQAGNIPPIVSFTFTPKNPIINEEIIFNATSSYDPDGSIVSYKWNFGDGNITGTTESIIAHSYTSTGDYIVNLTVTDDEEAVNSTNKTITVYPSAAVFDTRAPTNPYPSICGNHTGTIKPNQTITVHKLYTYPCSGTGGHTEHMIISNSSGIIAEAHWNGYVEDWHNITFNEIFTLFANETYNFTIRTGSYPQIIHEPSFNATGSKITCTNFTDANGVIHYGWIPAIRLLL